jgi:outer membrane protein OmpA-like peptidoglycan-associated protein
MGSDQAPFASSAARGYATTRLCEKSECRDDNRRVDFEILKRH